MPVLPAYVSTAVSFGARPVMTAKAMAPNTIAQVSTVSGYAAGANPAKGTVLAASDDDDDSDGFTGRTASSGAVVLPSLDALNNEPFLLTLSTDINKASVQPLLHYLLAYDQWYKNSNGEYDPQKMARRPVHIIINSPGGSIVDLMSMLDQLDFMKDKGVCIKTYIHGRANSGAAVLASAGSKGHRYVSPRSLVVLHQASLVGQSEKESVHNVHRQSENAKQQNQMMLDMLSVNTYGKVNPQQMAKDTLHDLYLSPKALIDYGLADQIGVLSLKPFSRTSS
jgi:ATP-dependent Clp protease, protease subunit